MASDGDATIAAATRGNIAMAKRISSGVTTFKLATTSTRTIAPLV